MNFNITGYFVYLSITIFIILRVGKICYKNGNIYVADLIPNHADICQKINQILLLAYYLLNIGYSAMTLISWQKITSSTQLIETICTKTAVIIFIISILHYFNILIITKYIQKIIHNNKN
ncbi:hypothetical protein ACHRVK_13175 [Flavobacterium plurextorum]|uniref:Uncharacterized protein n=1 Tax=Flavobacterium plurextorum TaxID=1114867 RepID=A0ABX4CZ09_9FLAO|nr:MULTISPECIES: hypothetical protein [Flavobacterium]OXB09978.1 hypothetical protein B0A81_04895 [Flavobacterium plurextorum]PIF59235.1 hypothetical protein CLU99_3807 [Flavobacterium sp. 2]UUW09585.1 hypothetical protein NLG42_02015 [Flavobacterium plurextorum]